MNNILDQTKVALEIVEEDHDSNYDYTITYSNGYVAKIMTDIDAESPRDWDNLGKMICWHRRYDLGDTQANSDRYDSIEELIEGIKEDQGDIYWLPLYLYDHSGITMSTSAAFFQAIDSQQWDWGMVGIIYVSKKKILEEWSVDTINSDLENTVLQNLIGEVDTYDMYLRNDVYYYTIEDENEDILESCGGFFGNDAAIDEAKSMVDAIWSSIVADSNIQQVLPFGDENA